MVQQYVPRTVVYHADHNAFPFLLWGWGGVWNLVTDEEMRSRRERDVARSSAQVAEVAHDPRILAWQTDAMVLAWSSGSKSEVTDTWCNA